MENKLDKGCSVHHTGNGTQSQNMMVSHMMVNQFTNKLLNYVNALRPWSFTASIIPVMLGNCLAYKSQGLFNIYIFLTTVVIVLCVHSAGNLINTYIDFIKGVDSKKSDDRTLVDNLLLPANVVALAGILYITAFVGFILLVIFSPAKVEHLVFIFVSGLSSSYLYTGGLGMKYIALGDVLIFLTFGPVIVMFSYLSQTGYLSLVPIVYAIPQALNTEVILHSNNTRDIESDRLAGVVTLAILLGSTGSYLLFIFMLFSPYLLYLTISVHSCPWMSLPAISIFLAFSLENDFRRGNLKSLPQKVAKLNLVMGILYVVALLAAHKTSLPYL